MSGLEPMVMKKIQLVAMTMKITGRWHQHLFGGQNPTQMGNLHRYPATRQSWAPPRGGEEHIQLIITTRRGG